VKFGISLGNCSEGLTFPIPFADGKDIVNLGVYAEELGYDSVWANDHITTQHYVKALWGKSPNYYEPLVILSFIAAKTRTIKIATGVIVLPNRDIPILAKQVSTLDDLSDGRLILGVGLGAYKEEFEAVNPSIDIKSRNIILDESIEALNELFNQASASYDGKFIKFKNIELYPKPKQKPFPLYIGGNSPKSLRRVAKYGRGWLPGMLTPVEIASMLEDLKNYCAKYRRNFNEIDIAPQLTVCVAKTREEAIKKFKNSVWYKHLESLRSSTLKGVDVNDFVQRGLIGNIDDVIDKIQAYIDAGVTNFPHIKFPVNDFNDEKKDVEFFAKEIIPSFR
jgi:probable F420-dependent oxidoreductase